MKPRKTHPYYNFDKLYSYNGTFNFAVGGRGIGKTYGAKKKAIRTFLKNGEQFIYLRRYKNELNTSKRTFFADIGNEFPDYDFQVVGNTAQVAPISSRDEKKREWLVMGFFVTLSTSQTQKGVSFPRVTTIIFDEFIIEKGLIHYLPDESTVFANFYSTVDRYQDKTRVLFLANSVSIMNPYFLEYEIRPDESDQFIIANDGFVVCHFIDSKNFANSVFETKFGKFIKDSEYAKYAVGNEFSDNSESMIALKNSKAKYQFSLETNNGKFSVWHEPFAGQYFIQTKKPKLELNFTIVPERMDTDKILMTFTDRPLQYLRNAFRQGSVYFDKPSTRNTFIEIFKR